MQEPKVWFSDVRTKIPGTEKVFEEVLPAHREYLARLREQRKLFMAGPWVDGNGGILIFDVPTIEEAKQLSSRDPAIAQGCFKMDVKAWRARVTASYQYP